MMRKISERLKGVIGGLFFSVGSAWLLWSAWDTLERGTPRVLPSRWGDGERTVSAVTAAGLYALLGGVGVVAGLGMLKYALTGRCYPFPNLMNLEVSRRRARAVGERCPFCAYSRKGLSRTDPCPECGKETPEIGKLPGE
jgi:hypothetical protein